MKITHYMPLLRLGFSLFVSLLWIEGAVFATPSFHEFDTLESALKRLYPTASAVTVNIALSANDVEYIESRIHESLPTSSITVYKMVTASNQLTGYAMVVNQKGKHYPMTSLVSIAPNMTVHDVVLLVYREDYGADVRKRRFLRQFKHKKVDDAIAVNHDITSVSGATISSYSMAASVRRVLEIVTFISKNV